MALTHAIIIVFLSYIIKFKANRLKNNDEFSVFNLNDPL
jgi:hypothetical protein